MYRHNNLTEETISEGSGNAHALLIYFPNIESAHAQYQAAVFFLSFNLLISVWREYLTDGRARKRKTRWRRKISRLSVVQRGAAATRWGLGRTTTAVQDHLVRTRRPTDRSPVNVLG